VSHRLEIAVLAALLAACNDASVARQRRPTAADALAALTESVKLASSDPDALCALGTASCDTVLASAGRPPLEPPRVVRNAAMAGADGLRLLVVCGRTRDGVRYETEMVVAYEGSRVALLQPVYWSGLSVGISEELPASEPPDASDSPSCG
jgi:hypothetical protein